MDKDIENNEWLELCGYVKKEILGYSDAMKFPKFIALRLRGLAQGQFMANKNQQPMANYDYKTILYTFKACKLNILSGLKSNNTKFTNEQHKFNYIMIIIENNINDMVIRLQNAKKAKEKAETLEVENFYYEGAKYKPKTKEENSNLKDLW